MIPYFGFLIFALAVIFIFNRLPFYSYVILLTLYFLTCDVGLIFWAVYVALSLILLVPQLRCKLVTYPLILLIKKLGLLPRISQTEKIALTSGTVWVDGQLFSGNPDLKWIFKQNYPKLTADEQRFLDNEVEQVCKICSDYEVQKLRDLPSEAWQFLKDKKFFGMIIPKSYGGLEFSAYAHSCVIQKLSSRSVPLAITAMVPNSLGPAELLLHYGTKAQRDYYLPRLADGRELPCFALTEPLAGSDATSITSNGVVFKDQDGITKIRLNWNKRYITLGGVATVIGVAFVLRDPDKILSNSQEIGITCALVPHDTAGVRQGRRHDPLATPFINSPLNGENVIITLDHVIGGLEGVGKGWKMLMECLAAGRGISLPSTSAGGTKMVARAVSAYAAIREQFGLSVGKFEGVEEVLARIASKTYITEALRSFTAGAIDSGSKPAVITAIAKYHATEMFRSVINDGMDVMGGRAIIRGKRNILANAYFSTPISITVEGANIMTRSLIHFGQGAIMCHPFAYKEIEALEKNDLKAFDKAFFGHIYHFITNLTRSILLSLSRGYLYFNHEKNEHKLVKKYQRKIVWASASFAFLADVAIIKFGGNLKRKEKLNGRFGDILSYLYLAICALKKFKEDGSKAQDEALLEYSLKDLLSKMQYAFEGIYQNLFGKYTKYLMLPFAFFARFNAFACPSNDDLGHNVVKEFIKISNYRDDLTDGIFINDDINDNLGRLEHALIMHEQANIVVEKIKTAIKENKLPKASILSLIDVAYSANIITANDIETMRQAAIVKLDAMQVDEYSFEEYKKI